jgi:hypothetical protein
MGLKTNPHDGRAERLAPWIRQMDLADQIFVTGTTLVFEDIRLRRTDLPYPIDEASLRESSPDEAYRLAMELSAAYAHQPPHSGNDGVNEHWRISNMARELAERIAKYHPRSPGGDV